MSATSSVTWPNRVDEIDLSDVSFWERPQDERLAAFAMLRRERPIAFFEEPEVPGLPVGPGYHAVTRHADVVEMSIRPDVFCSSKGATSVPDLPEEMLTFYGSMINMDNPRHARLRRIVQAAFTPRMIGQIYDDVARLAKRIVAEAVPKGEFDLVAEIAAPFPLIVICDMMGIPESERDFVLAETNVILSGGDPEFMPEGVEPIGRLLQAGMDLAGLMTKIAEDRVANPTDDLTSALVNTAVDGEKLTHAELASFFILLVAAGNETTRTATTHGVYELFRNPDQQRIWMNDRSVTDSAVEEIVRYASPVIFMRRTVTRDVEVGGHQFHEGDKVTLQYNAANRDETVFTDPDRFDVRRDPNPHLGFGARGPHFCLGAHLARREMAVIFNEMFDQMPNLTVTGEPAHLRSGFINGIKRLPVSVGG
ncbi:MAG: cytochrome P450 [Desertimonas sp.]